MPPKLYNLQEDNTLTVFQSKNKYFSCAPKSFLGPDSDFRVASNNTLGKYSTGYHESALTTDGYYALRKSTVNSDGSRTLQNSSSKILQGKINHESAKDFLAVADGFRTDTARTILSDSNKGAAGHSGSNMNLKGQSDAHDLLRKTIMYILRQDRKTNPGISRKSIAASFGAITIASIAPGEYASKVSGTLKDSSATQTWEDDRNEAKRRLDEVMDTLTFDERGFVHDVAKKFLYSTNDVTRLIKGNKAHSEERDNSGGGPIKGGGYFNPTTIIAPTKMPPKNPEDWGYYLTEPFRAQRRK